MEYSEDNNILKALLNRMSDKLVIKYMGYYTIFLDENLFLFSVAKNNKKFIQVSLALGAFNKLIFKQESVV